MVSYHVTSVCSFSCRSLSAKHCGLCDKCVMVFDHHCKSLMSIDEGLNSVRFTCGREGIGGATANAGVVLFTPSDPEQSSCVGNGTTVLAMVQQREGA